MQLEQPIAGYTGTPQTEDGFTRIANELLEAICFADLSKRQYKIMLSLVRQTYGYGKKSDDITISQLADKTGMALSHASSTVKELIAMQVINFSGYGKHGKILSINKHYDTWDITKTVSYQNSNVTKTVIIGYQNGNNRLPKRSFDVTETVNTIDNPKRNFQKKLPKETEAVKRNVKNQIDYSGEFSEAWALYPRKAGANKKLAYKQWCSRIVTGVNPQTIIDGVLRYSKYCDACQTEDRFIKQPETFFGPNDHYLSNWDVPASRGSTDRPKNNADKFQEAMKIVSDKFNGKEQENERDLTSTSIRLD